MPDLADTYCSSTKEWTPLPVPDEDVSGQCAIAALRITFKDSPEDTVGWLLRPGEAIPIRSGQQGHIKAAEAIGGCLVMESIG